MQRGPDCFGLYGRTAATDIFTKESLKSQSWENVFDNFFNFQHVPVLVLANFRGIPTTEFLAGGLEMDRIQPYMDKDQNYIVTHNGQLSNDEQLNQKYKYKSFTRGKDIDSYYFVRLLQQAAIEPDNFLQQLREIEGSYAVAAFSKPTSTLYFARSFRGLFFTIWKYGDDSYLVWASEQQALQQGNIDQAIFEMPLDSYFELQLPLYGKIPSLSKILQSAIPIKEQDKNNSCVVVLSGGMDSTVCLSEMVQKYQDIHVLHFLYGARAQEREVESVISIVDWFVKEYPNKQFHLQFVDLDFVKKLGGSTLTDYSLPIAQGELAIETTHEWVPARNIAMIGLATSYCDRHNIGAIVLGLNMEEGATFEDNSIEFYQRMEAALQIGSHSKPKLLMPLGNSMKHAIWKKGRELNTPLHLSWSCYLGEQERCGTCGPCSMRQRAAAMNGEVDNLVAYTDHDPVAVQIFNKVMANF